MRKEPALSSRAGFLVAVAVRIQYVNAVLSLVTYRELIFSIF